MIEKMFENGRHSKSINNYQYKNGQAGKYVRLRKYIIKNNIKCIECGTNKNVQIHHKEKLNYDKFFKMWKTNNFRNDIKDVLFLCGSCHQKLHYRKLNRRRKGDIK